MKIKELEREEQKELDNNKCLLLYILLLTYLLTYIFIINRKKKKKETKWKLENFRRGNKIERQRKKLDKNITTTSRKPNSSHTICPKFSL